MAICGAVVNGWAGLPCIREAGHLPHHPHLDAAGGVWDITSVLPVEKVDEYEVPAQENVSQAAMEESGENPKQARGEEKPPLHYVPPAAIIGMAKALGEGGKKYGPYNWRHIKVRYMTYIGGAMRHLAAALDGEDIDPESTVGKTHIEGALGSLAVLQDAIAGGFLVDDRPPKGPAPEMLRAPGFKEK